MPYITDDVSAENIIGLAAQYVCCQWPSDCLLPGPQSVVQPSLLVWANAAFEHASEPLSGGRIIRSNVLDRQSIIGHICSPDFHAARYVAQDTAQHISASCRRSAAGRAASLNEVCISAFQSAI